jgi:hypothetical protein
MFDTKVLVRDVQLLPHGEVVTDQDGHLGVEHRTLPAGVIVRARALLRERVPPAEAALMAGFSDQSHLGRWFRRSTGRP